MLTSKGPASRSVTEIASHAKVVHCIPDPPSPSLIEELNGEHEVQVVLVADHVVKAAADQFDLALELLDVGPLDKLDALGARHGSALGDLVDGRSLVNAVTKAEHVADVLALNAAEPQAELVRKGVHLPLRRA